MTHLKAAGLGVAMLAFTGGAAFAMDTPMKMSKADTKMMKSCHAMSHEVMMKKKGCMKMMKMHPDMMKDDAMMKHDGMMKK